MKRLMIGVVDSNRKPYKIQIRPGTRTSDIRAYLKLHEGYVLTLVSEPGFCLTEEDDVYFLLMDGERLVAGLSPQAAQRQVQKFVAEDPV